MKLSKKGQELIGLYTDMAGNGFETVEGASLKMLFHILGQGPTEMD
jgi:hypothetical protein